ncbi:signal peptidase II [Kineococcus gynurae]|uniref:Lipoprotein signal peptidase n=1 Tax=Kineococcus gynurae TaxID=452979 RepID=A0ABV5LXU2_9ACTN
MTETSPPQPPAREPDPETPPARRTWLFFAVAAVLYAADQLTKVAAVASLEPGVPYPVLGEIVQLRLIRNPGAAFSFATGMTWIFTIIATVVVVVVIRVSRRLRSRAWAVALGLLLAGALGNLTDRFLRQPGFARGHVVDFVQLPHWPIFNVADSCICAAAVLVAVLAFRNVGLDGRPVPSTPRRARPARGGGRRG